MPPKRARRDAEAEEGLPEAASSPPSGSEPQFPSTPKQASKKWSVEEELQVLTMIFGSQGDQFKLRTDVSKKIAAASGRTPHSVNNWWIKIMKPRVLQAYKELSES